MLELVLVTGMSGSGKSVVLHALEDAGYYCVDNLPPQLLESFVKLHQEQGTARVAIAVDVRSADALPMLPPLLRTLRDAGLAMRVLFLDATDETLVRRYSETRRRHPLSSSDADSPRTMLTQAIAMERELLETLRDHAHVIDTSLMRPAQAQAYVKDWVSAPPGQLLLVFESFAFKRSIPVDADYVFDVRMLPNPHYEPALRELTGRDAPVAAYLQGNEWVERMFGDIEHFLQHWLPLLAANHRSYATVAIGCTGGQHRSVYLVERLAEAFGGSWPTLKRHRELGI